METYLGAPVRDGRVDWGLAHEIFLFDYAVRMRVRQIAEEMRPGCGEPLDRTTACCEYCRCFPGG